MILPRRHGQRAFATSSMGTWGPAVAQLEPFFFLFLCNLPSLCGMFLPLPLLLPSFHLLLH